MRDKRELENIYIKSYAKDLTPIRLLERAINIFFEGEMNHDVWSRDLHMLGFQGLKRWHKMQSKEDRHQRVYNQHKTIDTFGVNIEVEFKKKPKHVEDIRQYYQTYLEWEIFVYEELNEIANELVNNGYNEEANDLLKAIKGVRKEIEKVRRHIQDAETVQYDMTYLKLMDKDLHAKLKIKEECHEKIDDLDKYEIEKIHKELYKHGCK